MARSARPNQDPARKPKSEGDVEGPKAERSKSDAAGAKPGQLTLVLPEGHSLHATDPVEGGPRPRGIDERELTIPELFDHLDDDVHGGHVGLLNPIRRLKIIDDQLKITTSF